MNLDQLHQRFLMLTNALRGIGFKGEVLMKDRMLIIGAYDKFSASLIRRGFRKARGADAGTLTEVRGKVGTAFVWVDDSLAISRPAILELAKVA